MLGARAIRRCGRSRGSLAVLNRLIYTSERALGNEAGLPRRDWFKHLAYAPGLLHRLRREDAAGDPRRDRGGAWDEAKRGIAVTAEAVSARRPADDATRALTNLTI